MIIVNQNFLMVRNHLRNVYIKMIKYIIVNKNSNVEDNNNNNNENKDKKNIISKNNDKSHIKNNKRKKKVINQKYGIKYFQNINHNNNQINH